MNRASKGKCFFLDIFLWVIVINIIDWVFDAFFIRGGAIKSEIGGFTWKNIF